MGSYLTNKIHFGVYACFIIFHYVHAESSYATIWINLLEYILYRDFKCKINRSSIVSYMIHKNREIFHMSRIYLSKVDFLVIYFIWRHLALFPSWKCPTQFEPLGRGRLYAQRPNQTLVKRYGIISNNKIHFGVYARFISFHFFLCGIVLCNNVN